MERKNGGTTGTKYSSIMAIGITPKFAFLLRSTGVPSGIVAAQTFPGGKISKHTFENSVGQALRKEFQECGGF